MTTFAKRVSAMALAVGLGAGFALAGVVAPASAATLIVTSSADSGAGSLRDTLAGSASGDTITFAPAVTSIALESSLVLDWGVSIVGPGAGNLTITRGNLNYFDQFFFAPANPDQDLTISGLTIEGVPGAHGRAISVWAGGGAPRDVTLSGLVVEDETEFNPGGGAWIVNVLGNTLIEDSTFRSNTSSDGGAVYLFNDANFEIRDSTFSNNTAVFSGGAVTGYGVPAVVVSGSSFTSNAAQSTFGGAIAFDSGTDTLNVSNSTFTSNSSATTGGAITVQDLNGSSSFANSSFVGNSSANGAGGAVEVRQIRGTFEIVNSTFRDNSATDDTVFHGGAVAIGRLRNIGSMRVDSSTFSNNSANGSPGFGNSLGLTQLEGALAIISSTFNESGSTESYAISMNVFDAGAEISIGHSTIVGPGGVQIQQNPGSAQIVSSIIDGGAYPAARVPSGGNAIATWWSLLSSPLFLADMSDGGNNQFSVSDFKLGPLQNNGGATQTRLPLPTSPAFNTGDPAFASPPALDQRGTGFPRVALGRIDIGAVEGEFALADTGAKINYPVLIGGAVLVLLGIGAVVVGQIRRARR